MLEHLLESYALQRRAVVFWLSSLAKSTVGVFPRNSSGGPPSGDVVEQHTNLFLDGHHWLVHVDTVDHQSRS
jgi:hypothetical protein